MTLSRAGSWIAILVALVGLIWLSFFVRSAIGKKQSQQQAFRDIVYASPDGHELHMQVHVPPGMTKPAPVVMYIHGGGWRAGTYKEVPAEIFTSQGLAVASIQYRFTTVAPFPAQIHDCKAAVRYLRSHAQELGIDASRIGVFGGSAGGHLAALLGVSNGVESLEGVLGNLAESSRVQAVVDWYGPTDLPQAMTDLASIQSPPETRKLAEELLVSLAGGPLESKVEVLRSASPIEYVSRDDAPFLIYHGTLDQLVPYCQSTRFVEALTGKGVAAELITMVGKGHEGFAGPELAKIPAFFKLHLEKK